MIDAPAGFVAWLGASLVVVADGRRGLAMGTAFVAFAVAVLAYGTLGWSAAVLLAAGGAIAAVRRNTVGPPGWSILPAGSTPRLVLCVAAGLVAFWLAAGVMTGPGAPLRFAVIVVTGLAAARVYGSTQPPILLTATALLALAIGLAAGASADQGAWPYVAASLFCAVVTWVPVKASGAS